MRRTVLHGALVLLALGGAAAPARADTPAADTKVPLAAKLADCATGPAPADRAATFTGSMPQITGASRMLMRFHLLQRRGGSGSYKGVKVPNWDEWERSEPGRPGFIYTKRVDYLVAPAAYRAVVTFRWLDAKGRTVRTRVRTAGTCVQPDQRPDLVLSSFTAAALGTDQAGYTVGVRNDGRTSAGQFRVTVTVAGRELAPVALGPLDAGEEQTGTVTGPRCAPRSMVTIRVDPLDVVDESAESGNVVQQVCPLV